MFPMYRASDLELTSSRERLLRNCHSGYKMHQASTTRSRWSAASILRTSCWIPLDSEYIIAGTSIADPLVPMTEHSTERAAVPIIRLMGHSAVIPDWSREQCRRFWDPPRKLLGALRDYTAARQRGGVVGRVNSKFAAIRHRFWSVISGADIPLNATAIQGGLQMPHPNGIVIHPKTEIGPNCLLFQQVTLGTGPTPGTPRLGGHVDVGAGAKILGGVVVGDHAVIGANAVVVSDVPAWGVAVGVPAVVRPTARDGTPVSRKDVG